MSELYLNGVVEEEAGKFLHICFFTDREGYNPDNEDAYVFVPATVCRVVDYRTIAVQNWYVRKKNLLKYVSGKGL